MMLKLLMMFTRSLHSKLATAILVVLAISPSIFAQDFLPDKPVGMVNDFADIISDNEQQQLEIKLRNYRDSTTNVIAIATLESLQGYSREEIATILFNNWRMWEGERYNGVLLLISEQDREIKIEVGYGLEGAIPDVMANRIINNILTPNFKNNNYYQGIDEATDAMIQLAAGEFEGNPALQGNGDLDIPIDLILFFIILIFFLVTRGGGGKGKRRHTLGSSGILFYGGGFGGGFGGGGGFSGGGGGFGGFSGGGGFGSGGGGAGGGW